VALVDGERGALGAYLMMKRGCRVAVVSPPAGEPMARSVLSRFDPTVRIEVAQADPPSWGGVLGAAVQAMRADGIVLPLAVEQYPGAREAWGEIVLFSPTVGLTDDEVTARWRAVVALAG